MKNRFSGFSGFTYCPAIPREEGVTRRDANPDIRVDGLFHVWYSRNVVGTRFPTAGSRQQSGTHSPQTGSTGKKTRKLLAAE